MKDQYVGDVNDYVKYALLRELACAHPGVLHVCWMRTPPDERRDGLRLGYFREPARFRCLDPVVFDSLGAIATARRRTVRAVQNSPILPGARFHHTLLGDATTERARYFGRLWSKVSDQDLVFFDPDNGMEVASVPAGRRGSCKYLFWNELERTLALGSSVLVYQHFPRVRHDLFIARMLDQLTHRFPDHGSFAFVTPTVVYLACALSVRAAALRHTSLELASRLPEYLSVPFDAYR